MEKNGGKEAAATIYRLPPEVHRAGNPAAEHHQSGKKDFVMKKSKNSSNNTVLLDSSGYSLTPEGAKYINSSLLTPEELASMKEDFRRSSKYMKGRFKHLAPKK